MLKPYVRPLVMLGQLAPLFLALSSAGCGEEKDQRDEWYFEPSHQSVEARSPNQALVLELIDTLGQGLVSDGRGVIAISETGLVAVAEQPECRVTVLDLRTHGVVYRFGSCGEGPEEYRAIAEVAFFDDSLLMYDAGRRDLSIISPTGSLLRRFVPLAMVQDSVTSVTSLFTLGDSLIGFAHERPRSLPSVATFIHRANGALAGRIGNAQAAHRGDRDILVFSPLLCVTRAKNGTQVVASNPYQPEVVAYGTDGVVMWRTTDAGRPRAPTLHDQQVWPSAIVRPPVCNEQFVMTRTVDVEPWASRTVSLDRGSIEIWNRAGRLQFATTISGTHSELFSRGSGWGDRWVFNDAWGDVPMLRVYRLRNRTATDQSDIVDGLSKRTDESGIP